MKSGNFFSKLFFFGETLYKSWQHCRYQFADAIGTNYDARYENRVFHEIDGSYQIRPIDVAVPFRYFRLILACFCGFFACFCSNVANENNSPYNMHPVEGSSPSLPLALPAEPPTSQAAGSPDPAALTVLQPSGNGQHYSTMLPSFAGYSSGKLRMRQYCVRYQKFDLKIEFLQHFFLVP